MKKFLAFIALATLLTFAAVALAETQPTPAASGKKLQQSTKELL
ncbi:MAG: hypothetical protein ACXVB9_18930 [Bdellovibrionota bacterium]